MELIKIGISGLLPTEYDSSASLPCLSEIDLPSFTSWSRVERKHLMARRIEGHALMGSLSSAWLFSNRLDEPIEPEKISILHELQEHLKLQTLIIRVQSRHLDYSFPQLSPLPIYVDLPQQAREALPSGPALGLVWDPLWDPIAPAPGVPWVAKVHGWHPARWVRKYSQDQMRQCIHSLGQTTQTLPKGQSKRLIIGHSQRREQWREFASLSKEQML